MDTNNGTAWLIFYTFIDYGEDPCDYMIAMDETDALETYMALVEEEIYEIFYSVTQDEYEDRPIEEIAKSIGFYDSGYSVMKVPVI